MSITFKVVDAKLHVWYMWYMLAVGDSRGEQ